MTWYQHPLLHTVLLTVGTAIWVDISSWKSWGDVAFNWRKASFNWCKALLIGIFGYYGLNAGSSLLAGN